MKEVLETIISSLVDNKEAIEIKEVENEKTIVSDIASQIPMNCESVATIFLIHGASDRNLTIDYIKTQYGFVVN